MGSQAVGPICPAGRRGGLRRMHLISEHFFLFCVAFFAAYFFMGRQSQKYFIISTSLLFVTYASLWMAAILILSCVGNYLCSVAMARSDNEKIILKIGIIANVATLGLFKYFNFFTESLADAASLLGVHYEPFTWKIVAPLGLSFYTFQAISYLVDIRRRLISVPDVVDFTLYLVFWPKFIAGPIIRASWFLPQLTYRKPFRWSNLFLGMEMVTYGLFLKVVLSDNLIPQIDKVFKNPGAYDGANALLSSFFFTFQIYGDFAGYSLMVIGIARIMGYSVRRNFHRPNLARSFTDFWSRWHISLSSWLEDYVFRSLIPKKGRVDEVTWTSISAMYADLLGKSGVSSEDSFQALSGDSLSYVEVALALEAMLGELPQRWERLAVRDLEVMLAARVRPA
jgi:alginate O-acetyltransferase complex protein AlgI